MCVLCTLSFCFFVSNLNFISKNLLISFPVTLSTSHNDLSNIFVRCHTLNPGQN